MIYLVCGGRMYGERHPEIADKHPLFEKDVARVAFEKKYARETLDALDDVTGIISGKAKGGDTRAEEWALANDIPFTGVKAQWNKYGNNAGPMRNMQMLQMKPDVVLAFHGGTGTKHMLTIASKAQVKIIRAYDDYDRSYLKVFNK